MLKLQARFKLTALLSLLALATVSAEEPPIRRNTVSVHPLMSILVSGGHLTWERSFGEGYWTSEIPFYLGVQYHNTLNIGTGIGLRRYFQGGAKGWYASPQFTVIDWNRHGDQDHAPGQHNLWLMTSMRVGYKREIGRLVLNSALGGAYLKDFHLRQGYDVFDIVQPTWTPLFSLSAGWAF